MPFDFDGDKYRQASTHQKNWGNKLIAELALRGDESILDLGCGDGVLTRQLAELVPAGRVLGLDGSPGMIATALQQVRDNLSFVCMDINDLGFADEFDLIFSNATLHWVRDHVSLLANCFKALKRQGRLHWSFGGCGNSPGLVEALETSIASPEYNDYFVGFQWPWFMYNVEEYTALVKRAGYSHYKITLVNADSYYPNSDELIKWIDQPCLVPFLTFLKEENTKNLFRTAVISRMLERAGCGDGRYLEKFRRLNVRANK